MFTGICRVELHLMEGTSLKEKRQVIRSIIERLKNRFNISIAEVGAQDLLQRAEIGLATVGSDTIYPGKVMDRVIDFIENDGRVQIISIDRQVY